MALDLVNAAEAEPKRWLLNEQLTYQVLGLFIDVRLFECDLLALLNVVVGFEVRSAFEGSRSTKQLIQDDTKGPVVACVAELPHVAEGLRGKVLLGADERVHP